ncbi:MAG: thiamine pyrophosphate-dependent dehydrogenase E1 component subunit alpha [Acidimicrobiia bacterium]
MGAGAQLSAEQARTIYRRMATIRYGEDRIIKGMTAGEFAFSFYPVRGHEAIAATVGEVLRPDDQLTVTYRCFHDIVAKGTPLREIVAEQLGKITGTSKGKGGPMHISDPHCGLMVTTGIVGGGVPIATGLALAAQMDGSDRVVVTTFGDGATSIGAIHESMNLAAVWNLPLVIVCQNNKWGEHTAQHEYTKTENLADRAAAYGMVGVTVDGTDPAALLPVLEDAVARARRGEGPTFVEAVTYRIFGHTFGSNQSYQPKAELDAAKANEPVGKFRKFVVDNGLLSEADVAGLEADAKEEFDDALAFAQRSEPPGLHELFVDVFANPEEVPR